MAEATDAVVRYSAETQGGRTWLCLCNRDFGTRGFRSGSRTRQFAECSRRLQRPKFWSLKERQDCAAHCPRTSVEGADKNADTSHPVSGYYRWTEGGVGWLMGFEPTTTGITIRQQLNKSLKDKDHHNALRSFNRVYPEQIPYTGGKESCTWKSFGAPSCCGKNRRASTSNWQPLEATLCGNRTDLPLASGFEIPNASAGFE
jgi:hypothetical protein